MSDADRLARRFQVTLVVRDKKDDPSILDIVQVAFEDGLRAPTETGSAQVSGASEPEERRIPVSGQITTPLREQIEEALAKVIERFQAAGKEPKFDPATWVTQLSKVWAVIHKAKAAGVQLRLVPDSSVPPAEGT